jgi:hypothetical protein
MGGVTATSANTANALVIRNGSGNFSAGTITATSLTATTITSTNYLGTNVGTSGAPINAVIATTVSGTTASFTGTGTFATVLATTVTATTGAITTLNINGTGSSQLNISSSNAYGGAGYAGFLTLSNTTAGATNPNKYIRTSLDGTLEVVNNAYTDVPFQLSDAGALTVTGAVRANSHGVDGGVIMRPWTDDPTNFTGVATANMAGKEYMMISDGTNTFHSAGSGGSTFIRGGANSIAAEVVVTTTSVDVTGTMNINGYKAVRDLTNNGGQIQHGVVSSSAAIAAGGSMFIPYTFPVSFTGTPNVTMSYNTGTGGSVYVVTRVLAISSSGANFYFYNATTTAGVTITHQAQWIGIY